MVRTRWLSVLLLYGVGLIASGFLGKVGPLGPLLQRDLGVSLAQLGWMVSAITGVAGVLGAAVGFWLAAFGARRALLLGLVILAGAGMLTVAGTGADVMIAARVGEGVGYLLVVVAAPTLIVHLSRGPDQASALALWGTFVPVGLAISAWAGGAAAPVIGWPAWLSVMGALPALALPLVLAAIPADEPPEPRRTDRMMRAGVRPLLALAAAFGCIGLVGVVVIALLPTFLVEVRAATLAAAGLGTALVSLASVPGSLLAGWLMRHGAGLRALSLCSLVMPAAAVPAFASTGWVGVGIAAAAIVLFANGVVVSAMFAAVPRLADHPSGVALGNGLIASSAASARSSDRRCSGPRSRPPAGRRAPASSWRSPCSAWAWPGWRRRGARTSPAYVGSSSCRRAPARRWSRRRRPADARLSRPRLRSDRRSRRLACARGTSARRVRRAG